MDLHAQSEAHYLIRERLPRARVVLDKMDGLVKQISSPPELWKLELVLELPKPVRVDLFEKCMERLSNLKCGTAVDATVRVVREDWAEADIVRPSYFKMIETTSL